MERDDTDTPRYRRGIRQINDRGQAMRTTTDVELRVMTDELKARLTPRTRPAKRKSHLRLVAKQHTG
jgi:hypothetical protein